MTSGAAGSDTNDRTVRSHQWRHRWRSPPSVDNTGGDITANGGTIAISNNATITGGTLNTSGSGVLEATGPTTMSGVTISSGSTYTITSGSVTQLVGTVTNAGVIQIAAGPNNAALETSGAVSLTGGGTVTLSNSGTSVPGAVIAQAVASSPLTNVDNTIQGFGQIGGASGLILVNHGTVDANVSDQTLTSGAAGSDTNDGLFEATNGGTLAITTSVDNTGGDITANGGTIAIGNNATITGGTLNTSGSGVLEATGPTTMSGVTISSGSTYTITSGSVTQLVGTVTNAGVIQIAAGPNNAALETSGAVSLTGGGTVTLSNSGTSVPGAVIAQAVASSPLTNVDNTIQGFGQIGGASGLILVNHGTVDANVSGQTLTSGAAGSDTNDGLFEASNGGLLDVTGAITGGGQLEIGAGSEIELGGAASETTTFTGATNAKLRLDVPSSYTGTIAGFAAGTTLELANSNAITATPTSNGANTTLTVKLSGGGALTYELAGNLTNNTFAVTHVGSDSTDLTVACFAAGARILTAAGEAPVEELCLGDRVPTLSSRLARIAWLGHRRIDCRHTRSTDAWPIRVRAGAFGDGLPIRDLLLSPDHAVFVAGVLVPVRHLVNDCTVVQERIAQVTYYHVKLAAHDVILAEGLPCESYLDTGNRAAFEDSSTAAVVVASA